VSEFVWPSVRRGANVVTQLVLLVHLLLVCVRGFVLVLLLCQWVLPSLLCWFQRVLLGFGVVLFRPMVIV
jgi:hypothetical protein